MARLPAAKTKDGKRYASQVRAQSNYWKDKRKNQVKSITITRPIETAEIEKARIAKAGYGIREFWELAIEKLTPALTPDELNSVREKLSANKQ